VPRSSRAWRSLAAIAGLGLAASLAVAACTPGSDDAAELPPLPTVPSGVSTIADPDDFLGSAPGACRGPQVRSRRVAAGLGPIVGRTPLWAGFPTLLDPERGLVTAPRDTPKTSAGWEVEMAWALEQGAPGPVEIQGVQRGGEELPLRFALLESTGQPTTSLVLDPRRVPPGPKGYRFFPARLYIPRGDCFSFEARLADGSGWRVVLGIGI
jgi:hypothetical protein